LHEFLKLYLTLPRQGKDQYGMVSDAIAALRVLYERSSEHNNKVFICYVDYKKAFDHVNWIKLMDILQKIGVDWRDRRLIWNLYNGQAAYVRIGDGHSSASGIGRGVRQGYSLSPLLYLIYDEAMIKAAFDDISGSTLCSRD